MPRERISGSGDAEVRDEVCGMSFPARQAVATKRYRGRTYYFCAVRCRDLFKAAPGRYVSDRVEHVGAQPPPSDRQ